MYYADFDIEKILEQTSTPEYAKWLYNYISRLPGEEFDDESVLDDKQTEDTKKAALLSYFLEHVTKLAEEQRIENNPDKDNEYEVFNYDIKILDKFFNISNMVGDREITLIRKIENQPEKYVNIL